MAQHDLDLLVLGGGAAGLTAAGTAAALGMKTMLVEKHRLGGDCTWTGCVPSKTLLHVADLRASARALGAYTAGGAGAGEPPEVDFPAVMAHLRELREEVYHHADAPETLAPFGVDVVGGTARFTSPNEVQITPVDGAFTGDAPPATTRVTFRKAIICTGGRAAPPPIPGLDSVGYLTNEGLFELTEQPERLVIVGAGPIGCEMGQAFQRLGTQVTIVDRADGALGKDDADHAAIVRRVLEREGVRFVFSADVKKAEPADGGGIRLRLEAAGETSTVEGDRLLIATGRKPNIEELGLDAAGVAFTKRGVTVSEACRTSQSHIWAAGDVTGEYALTHMSEHMGKTAATNAAIRLGSKMYRDGFTWTTFTTPEIAQVGKTEAELNESGADFVTYRFPYTKVDRAITEDATDGHIKVHATKWRGKILGASVVGARAGELVALYAVAMKGGVSVREISDTIIAYPTYGLGARRAADQYYVQKQFPTAIKAIKRVFGYRGLTPPPPDPDRVV